MARLLTIEPIDKSPTLNFFKKKWNLFQSFDSFTRLMVVSFTLIILSTPFIVANTQIFNARAAETPTSGQYFTVQVGAESFVFYTSIQKTIYDATNAYNNNLALHPNGRLARGKETYNSQWSWHYDPADVHMAEISAEICDGKPSDVERDLDYWVDTVMRFCPWSGRIVGVGLTPTPTPPDTIKPTVSITIPINGGTVPKNSTIIITATASDNIAVTKVVFNVNGLLTCTDTAFPYSCSWKVPKAAKKTYKLQANAYDAAGNVSLSSIVTVTSK